MSERDEIEAIYKKLEEMSEFLGEDSSKCQWDSEKARRGETEFEMMKNEFL